METTPFGIRLCCSLASLVLGLEAREDGTVFVARRRVVQVLDGVPDLARDAPQAGDAPRVPLVIALRLAPEEGEEVHGFVAS
jgi:hypothetical protein